MALSFFTTWGNFNFTKFKNNRGLGHRALSLLALNVKRSMKKFTVSLTVEVIRELTSLVLIGKKYIAEMIDQIIRFESPGTQPEHVHAEMRNISEPTIPYFCQK